MQISTFVAWHESLDILLYQNLPLFTNSGLLPLNLVSSKDKIQLLFISDQLIVQAN